MSYPLLNYVHTSLSQVLDYKEAVILFLQEKQLSPRQSTQLKWSRFVGHTGCNIPCDLHTEHLNRRLKTIIRNMGSNVTESSFKQAAASINVVNHICQKFEKVQSKPSSSHHPYPSFKNDIILLLICTLYVRALHVEHLYTS